MKETKKKASARKKAQPKKKKPVSIRAGKYGRPTIWETIIEPNKEKILEMFSRGATRQQIASYFRFDSQALSDAINTREDFRKEIETARINQEALLVETLFTRAKGSLRRVKTESFIDEKGHKVQITIQQDPPDAYAISTLLGRFHKWKDGEVAPGVLETTGKTDKEKSDEWMDFAKSLGFEPRSDAKGNPLYPQDVSEWVNPDGTIK